MIVHAKLSASGSSRWLNCTGSVKAEKGIKDKGSVFAAEGTAAHELADRCLTEECSADTKIGETIEGFLVDQSMADYVQVYIDYVNNLGKNSLYEVRVDFSPWVPEGFGTCDAMVFQDDGILNIIDLKYGQGVRVDADENTQGMLYALGAYEDFSHIYDFEEIRIIIVQPRLDHISEWVISVSDLLYWADNVVKPQAQLCLTDDAPRNPSEKACQWCKAKPTCAALKRMTEDTIIAMFDDLEPSSMTPSDMLTDDQLALALTNKKLITGWLDSVEKLVTERLSSGDDFKGYKIVEGRSLRKWLDEDNVSRWLSEKYSDDELYKKSFLSVTQAEKLMGKAESKALTNFITKPAGKPTLAIESDKRPAINLQESDFNAC